MARTTRKSLAGTAVSVARKAMGRKPAAEAAESAAKAPAAKKSAAKTPAKKAAKKSAKKSAKNAQSKTPATKAAATPTAKKAATATTAAKAAGKTPARKAPAKGTAAKAAKKAPAKAAKKATKKAAPTGKASTRESAGAGRPSALVVKEGESAWTKAEIKEVLDELTELRERVVLTLAAQEEELADLMRDAGDGAGQDQADMGATSFERDHELTVVNNEREKLAQIDRALARIEDGSYGVCESCGSPIGKMRLMAFPRATLCLTCKQREERR